MTFLQLVEIVKARRRWALVALVGVVVISMVIAFLMPKQYTSTVSVVVDVKSDPLATSMFSEQSTSAYVGTQVDIASSERVALKVVKTLKLDQVPTFRERWLQSKGGRGDYNSWLANTLLRKVTVKPSPQSNVIDISMTWPDAKASATLANAFAEAYIDTDIALKVEMAKQYASFFEERARTLRADLEGKMKELSDFENKTGIVATDDRLDVENARLAELSTQLVTAQGQRQDAQSRQQQAGNDEESTPEVLQNSLVVTLKSQLSSAEAREHKIAVTLGTNHPEYKSTEAEVNSLRARLDHERASIISALGDTTKVDLHRESDIKAAVEAQKKRILELKHQRDQVAVLQNDITTIQKNLESVTSRLAQSNLEGSTEQTNIALLTPATEPGDYSSPKYLLTFILSVVGGSFLGIAIALLLETWDPRVRRDEELLPLLGVPLLGSIGSIAYPPGDDDEGAPASLSRLTPQAS
jgi:chain length determinant protein EpsF